MVKPFRLFDRVLSFLEGSFQRFAICHLYVAKNNKKKKF